MKPMQQPFDSRPCFVYMDQLLREQQTLEDLHRWRERAGGLLYPVRQRSLGERTREQILEDLTNALHRQQLILRQIDGKPAHGWSILGRSLHAAGKTANRLMLTARTGEDLHLMFCDHQTQHGQLMNLPTFFDLSRHPSQLALALLAMTGPMDHHVIGACHHRERVSSMAPLASRRLAALWTLLLLAFEAITRRLLATVMAIFGQSPLQLCNPKQRAHQQSFQFLNPLLFLRQGFFEFRVLFSQLTRFFFRHARSVSVLSSPFQRT